MIRFIQFFIFLAVAICSSQITIGSFDDNRNITSVDSLILKQIKNGTLIIVKPAHLDIGQLQDIASRAWTLGKVKVIDYSNFNALDYISSEFVVCRIHPFVQVTNTNLGLTAYLVENRLDFYVMDEAKLELELQELEIKKRDKKIFQSEIEAAFNRSRKSFASIKLHDNSEVITDINLSSQKNRKEKLVNEGLMSEDQDALSIQDIYNTVYNKDYFKNLNYGMFQNYLQEISTVIKEKSHRNPYNNISHITLKSLKTKTLYVPDYLNLKLNFKSGQFEKDKDQLEKLLKKYDYKHQVIDNQKLSEKIIAGEDFYYLRFASGLDWQFVDVVHSLTGRTIFTNHETNGLLKNTNLRSRHFKELSKRIDQR